MKNKSAIQDNEIINTEIIIGTLKYDRIKVRMRGKILNIIKVLFEIGKEVDIELFGIENWISFKRFRSI